MRIIVRFIIEAVQLLGGFPQKVVSALPDVLLWIEIPRASPTGDQNTVLFAGPQFCERVFLDPQVVNLVSHGIGPAASALKNKGHAHLGRDGIAEHDASPATQAQARVLLSFRALSPFCYECVRRQRTA